MRQYPNSTRPICVETMGGCFQNEWLGRGYCYRSVMNEIGGRWHDTATLERSFASVFLRHSVKQTREASRAKTWSLDCGSNLSCPAGRFIFTVDEMASSVSSSYPAQNGLPKSNIHLTVPKSDSDLCSSFSLSLGSGRPRQIFRSMR
jgi:hypothetical protein